MVNTKQEFEPRQSRFPGILLAALLGGLAGALAMLLWAPQSGRNTRHQIQEKGIELRDRTTGMVHDAVEQMRFDRSKIATGRHQSPQEYLHQGQVLVARRLNSVSGAGLAGRNSILSP